MYDIKYVLDQWCANVEDNGPTLNRYSTNLLQGLAGHMSVSKLCISGDPVNSSGQLYNNIFEQGIVIRNHMYIHLAYSLCLII